MPLTSLSRPLIGLGASALAFVLGLGAAQAADRAIIVLDASGSMWGQIDGEAKISIARRTLGQVLGGMPADTELGLIVYGHREKGKCSDIELIVPPAPGTAGAITSAVNDIKPKGKTPLSDAVRQAAEALKFTEEKATVILITDGLETCNADPCALGRELEASGVDFTAHVVGFGLSEKDGRQVACLAEETGGLYLPAGNAGELTEALTETVKAETPEQQSGEVEAQLTAALTAPDEAGMATVVTVGWDAPGEKNDRIEIFDPNARQGEGKVLRNYPIRYGDLDARTVRVTVPATAGAYELRYFHAKSRKILATRPITVTQADVALIAPDSAPIAKRFTVEWIGPGARHDQMELWDPNALGGDGKRLRSERLRSHDFENRKVTMPAPGKPGTYELRYWNGTDRTVLATRSIEIVPMTVSMELAGEAAVGRPLVIDWIGPGARYDQIELWDPAARGGEGKRIAHKSLRNDDFDNQRVTLPGPAAAGPYELRYWNGDNRVVLATLAIEIAETVYGLDAPESIEAGRTIRVTWEGPGARYDAVRLWDPDARGGEGKKVFEKRLRNDDFDNRTVTLPGPAKAGTYELQYWNGDNRKVMATRPIVVTEAVVELTAKDRIGQGFVIKVDWVGPGARYDAIQVWDPNARGGEGKRLFEKRLRNDDFDNRKVTLPGPVKVGTYELRYWNGDNRKVMATRPIEVVAIEIGLSGPEVVEPETRFGVTWTGPGARYDEVQIFDPARDKVLARKRLRNDDFDNRKVTIKAPKQTGEFVLRYWNGDNKAVLAEVPLSVN